MSVKIAKFLEYTGAGDQEDPQEFLDEIEKIQAALGCSGDQMV